MRRSPMLVIALAVALFACGYFVNQAGGQPPAASSAPPLFPIVRVQYLPHPRDQINLIEGAPFTVPTGKLLVVKDFGSDAIGMAGLGPDELLEVDINSAAVWMHRTSTLNIALAGVMAAQLEAPAISLTTGVVAKAGDVVEVKSSNGTAYASGFLAEQ